MHSILPIGAVPITYGGTARHNIANALSAIAVAMHFKLPIAAIRQGLREFGINPRDNPGRASLYRLKNGAHALVDYAHNPDGMHAIMPVADSLERKRRIMSIGQAGDRSDEEIAALADIAIQHGVDHVVIKEMPDYYRGRAPLEISGILRRALERGGLAADCIEVVDTDVEATQRALELAGPGDQLVLLIHAKRDACLALIDAAAEPVS
jgi:cyanophycin synthetase